MEQCTVMYGAVHSIVLHNIVRINLIVVIGRYYGTCMAVIIVPPYLSREEACIDL